MDLAQCTEQLSAMQSMGWPEAVAFSAFMFMIGLAIHSMS